MKHDNLEKYIIEERAAFDLENPPLKAWYGIEKQLKADQRKGRIVKMRNYLSRAAVVLLLLVAGGVIGSLMTRQYNGGLADTDTRMVAPELQEAEAFYQKEVQNKVQQLTAYSEQHEAVLKDLGEVDQFLRELKSELEQAPKGSEELIIQNIIRSYQAKLEILERVLYHIQNNKIDSQNSEYNEISI